MIRVAGVLIFGILCSARAGTVITTQLVPNRPGRLQSAQKVPNRSRPSASIVVRNPWVRWLPAGLPMAGYMTLRNTGTRPIRLIGASSGQFLNVMLHRSVNRSGVDRMERARVIVIPAGGSFSLEPGGFHLMLMHGSPEVRPGGTVTIELHFDGHAPLWVHCPVRRPTGMP